MAGHGSDLPDLRNPAACWGHVSGAREPPGCRFDAGDAAKMGREPDTARRIAAESQGRAASGDQGRLAAAASAGSTSEIVRVVGAAVDQIVGFVSEQKIRQICFAEGDSPGSTQTFY